MKKIHKTIAAVTAGVLILGLSVYAIVLHNERNALKRQVTSIYTRAFDELLTDMSSLEAKLFKLEVANSSNQHAMLLMDVWRQAGETESAIASLPVSFEGTCTLTQFVNRTGDYCHMLSRKIALGEALADEDFEQLRSMGETCREVYAALDEVWRNGGYPDEAGFLSSVYMSAQSESANLDFANQQFPRLIYDGPFSESTEDRNPQALRGLGEVTSEKAAQAAAKFLEIDVSALTLSQECNGDIPCYTFTGEKQGVAFSIQITRKGGKVLWYMSQHDGGISAVPTDEKYGQLSQTAQQFLRDKGYGESAPSYAQFYNGLAVINLAPLENDIVLYPDLIKVWVDIPTGRVMGFDANNYLMSHKRRGIMEPDYSKEQAQEKINKNLQVENVRLALIPLESGEERLCWEFTGTHKELEFLIYINVKTGVEEDILIIQHTNEGTLVM